MNYLFSLDTNLFLLINHLPHNLLWDSFFGVLSLVGEYGAIWFALSFLLFLPQLRQPRKPTACEAKKLAVIWLTGVFSLFLIFLLKNIFGRLRPEFVLQNVILPFGSDASFSFPSGHALMSFVFAFVIASEAKQSQDCRVALSLSNVLLAMTMYLLAILISFSRIYLGFHYPSDILGGAVLGLFIGFFQQKFLRIFV